MTRNSGLDELSSCGLFEGTFWLLPGESYENNKHFESGLLVVGVNSYLVPPESESLLLFGTCCIITDDQKL
jgi:hypothetical protein